MKSGYDIGEKDKENGRGEGKADWDRARKQVSGGQKSEEEVTHLEQCIC